MARTTPVPLVVGAAAVVLAARERRGRGQAERLAAALLETLLNAIDATDPQTGAHVRRVARYALVLADAAELAEHDQRSIERVALFHDIGKIHEALFDIIHDGGELTPAERRAIATHPQRGAEVLEPLRSFYPDLAAGVLAHHERWDGMGYPRGLAGRRIPRSARIVSIADTFDAVTQSRRYRTGRGSGEAVAVVGEGRGTQFDPELVDLFLSPPVLARVEEEMREAQHPLHGRAGGRRRRKSTTAPDITFRWRSEGREPRAPDRASRKASG